MKYELSNKDIEAVDVAIQRVDKLDPDNAYDHKLITKHLKPLASIRSRFTSGLPDSVMALDGKQNRLFRRLMTLYGKCKRNHFRNAAMTALRQLPDMRVLRKSLIYLSQLDYRTHDKTLDDLFVVLETGELPFPYQAAMVLGTIAKLQPTDPSSIGSRIRSYALSNKQHWLVIQRALEVIAVYPYQDRYALNLARSFLKHSHPMVRRAACALLTRGPKDQVRKKLEELIYHADPGVNRLALYLQRFIRDKEFARQELARLRKGSTTDFAFQRNMHRLFALSATENDVIAEETYDFVVGLPATKSGKIRWLRNSVLGLTNWTKELDR